AHRLFPEPGLWGLPDGPRSGGTAPLLARSAPRFAPASATLGIAVSREAAPATRVNSACLSEIALVHRVSAAARPAPGAEPSIENGPRAERDRIRVTVAESVHEQATTRSVRLCRRRAINEKGNAGQCP